MFFRRKPQPVEITPMAYTYWLRAGRPPFDDFLRMSAVEQEHLAQLGDEHTQDVCVAIATALTNPDALVAGVEDQAEEEARSSAALDIAQRMASKVTMGGTGGRRETTPRSDRPRGTLFGAEGEQIG